MSNIKTFNLLLSVMFLSGLCLYTNNVEAYLQVDQRGDVEINSICNISNHEYIGHNTSDQMMSQNKELENNNIEKKSTKEVAKLGETPKFVIYDDAPQAIKRVIPAYPAVARQEKIKGTVLLEAEVFKDGSVGAVEVLESLLPGKDGLDEAAVQAVKQWEFKPAKKDGQPVAVWIKVPIEFKMQ